MSRPAIVFIGFMGAGKSTALSAVAPLVRHAVDLDERIERHIGMPISLYFEQWNEEQFRSEEARLATDLLREAEGGAVAFGGGTVLSKSVQEALKDHVVVYLEVDAQTAWSRVKESDRPLAKDWKSFEQLLAQRKPLYEQLADAIIPMIGAEDVAVAARFAHALTWMPTGTKMLWAESRSGSYPVYVGKGLLRATGDDEHWPLAGNRFCIADETVGPLYANQLPALSTCIEIPAGEKAKTLGQVENVLRVLAREGMTREDHVIALGGGVVGDLAGLCAHLYQRGVRVVQVPTTVVAQVDSAYGGKTGVDLPEGKNYAGAYHMPTAVIADTQTLASLPRKEIAAGFVEVLKTGLLAGGELWEKVQGIQQLDPNDLAEIVYACARYKCSVVAEDEQDAGQRHVLNLGHTVGHAIEAAGGYGRYRHGEAIGIGLLAALRLSDAEELRNECMEILQRHDLPTYIDPSLSVSSVLELIGRDKKRSRRGVQFVLLRKPGEPLVGQILSPMSVREAVEELYP